jgi:hypothetical protein
MSNFNIEDINTTFSGVTYIVAATGQVVTDQTVTLNKRYMLARLKIAELNENTLGLELVDGYRKVDFFVNVGGRSELVLDIEQVEVASLDPADAIEVNGQVVPFPGGLTIIGHGLDVGDKIVYLTNGNTAITGLVNGQEYFVVYVADDTVVLSTDLVSLVTFTSATKIKVHSIIDLGGIRINV